MGQALKQQSGINTLLQQYRPHSLTDLKNAALMDRVDSKFILPLSFLPEVLQQMKSAYSILEINGKRTSNYFNQYFDTNEMRFYRDHHNGKLNRFKVRHRTYIDTNTQFLEVKFKNNQKRTLKSRIKIDDIKSNEELVQPFISDKLGRLFSDLSLSQQSGYQRIALASEERSERLTLDFDLWYRRSENEEKIQLPGFFVAELKQQKRTKRSPFYTLMSQKHYSTSSFSKYCIGCALLYGDTLKQNSFKRVLTHINKLNPTNILG